MHILSMERMQNFKSDNQPIDEQLVGIAEASKTRKEEERKENRRIVQTIFDLARHLAKQNTAFRGHDETDDSANRGNFLEELHFLAKYDKPLKRWTESNPQNLSYVVYMSYVKYCRWPTFFIRETSKKTIQAEPNNSPSSMGINPDVVVNQFVLFSKSRGIKVWKQKYEEFLKMKEIANNDPSTKEPETWLCLPTLLKVFAENLISNLYPDLFDVVKIIATLPVTVASCERAHSKVKIINNYLRASMSDDRLESLVHISIERDIADKIELDTLVDTFRLAKNRKLPL